MNSYAGSTPTPSGTGSQDSRLVRVAAATGVVAVVLVALGLVLQNQADFSRRYVHDQLAAHKITFVPVAALSPDQRAVPCLVANAGKALVTAPQAECYANYQIGLDMQQIDQGKGYSEVHYAAYILRMKASAAVSSSPNDPQTAALVAQSESLSRKADDLLAGEAVKGLLLTAYGFGLLGERGGQAATVCFAAAGVMLLVTLGLVARSRATRRAVEGGPVLASPVGIR